MILQFLLLHVLSLAAPSAAAAAGFVPKAPARLGYARETRDGSRRAGDGRLYQQVGRSFASAVARKMNEMDGDAGGDSGTFGYLDAISRACNAKTGPSDECAGAITSYLDALSTGKAKPDSASPAALTIASYLDGLSASARGQTAGETTAVASEPPTSSLGAEGAAVAAGAGAGASGDAPSSGATSDAGARTPTLEAGAVASYLDALSSGSTDASRPTPPSREAVSSYLEAISTKQVNAPSSAGEIASYIDTLSKKPVDAKKTSPSKTVAREEQKTSPPKAVARDEQKTPPTKAAVAEKPPLYRTMAPEQQVINRNPISPTEPYSAPSPGLSGRSPSGGKAVKHLDSKGISYLNSLRDNRATTTPPPHPGSSGFFSEVAAVSRGKPPSNDGESEAVAGLKRDLDILRTENDILKTENKLLKRVTGDLTRNMRDLSQLIDKLESDRLETAKKVEQTMEKTSKLFPHDEAVWKRLLSLSE